jgi:hypothetical protein
MKILQNKVSFNLHSKMIYVIFDKMRHCELKDPEPNPDPKLLGNAGSGSVYNEYGSAALPACYHEYPHKTIIPCPSQYAIMNFNIRKAVIPYKSQHAIMNVHIRQSFPSNPCMLS